MDILCDEVRKGEYGSGLGKSATAGYNAWHWLSLAPLMSTSYPFDTIPLHLISSSRFALPPFSFILIAAHRDPLQTSGLLASWLTAAEME